MQKVLAALAEESARVEGKTLGDARFLYADDVASALVARAHGAPQAFDAASAEQLALLGAVHLEIEQAIAAWVLFVNDALDAYFRRGIKRGASWQREDE